MNPKVINIATNVLAFIIAVFEPVRAYLTTQPFEWGSFLLCLATAVIAFFTGKSAIYLKKDGDI